MKSKKKKQKSRLRKKRERRKENELKKEKRHAREKDQRYYEFHTRTGNYVGWIINHYWWAYVVGYQGMDVSISYDFRINKKALYHESAPANIETN